MKHESIEQVVIEEPEVIKILLTGRERVAHGWCQGTTVNGDTYCMVGAVTDRIDGSWQWQDTAIDYLERAIGWRPIPSWNDTPGRTQAEAVVAYDKAIELARADYGR